MVSSPASRMTSAPNSCASLNAAADRSTAMTRAPRAEATITADRPTPPHPYTATHSPGWTRPCTVTARKAVAKRQPSDAAATKSRASGRCTMLKSAAGIATSSANEPAMVKPGCNCWGQICASPETHHEHRPQPQTNGAVTRSPIAARLHLRADRGDDAGELVAGDLRKSHGVMPLPGVPIGSADSGRAHFDQHTVVGAHRVVDLDQGRDDPIRVVADCLHDAIVDAPLKAGPQRR